MKQRFLSFFVIFALMASVMAGAMSVSLNHASANQPDANDIVYLGDFEQYLIENSTFDSDQLTAFFDFVSPKVNDIQENEMYLVSMIVRESSVPGKLDVAISLFERSSTTTSFLSRATGGNYVGIGVDPLYGDNRIRQLAYLNFNYAQPTNNTLYVSPDLPYTNYNYTRQTAYSFAENTNAFGSLWDFNNSLNDCYYSKVVNGLSPICPHNLYAGDRPISYDEINLVTFHVGIKRFLTVDDQDYVQGMDPDKEGYSWAFFGLDQDGNDFDRVLTDSDLVIVPNADFYTDELFNLATYGALCWELPDELDVIASSGFGVRNALGQIDDLVAVCINCPYWINEELPNDEQLQDEQYLHAWDQFNTYVTNYNTTHVIPEQLSDWLFDTDGAKLFPVTVQVPHAIWLDLYHSSDAPNNHVWRWGGLLAEEHGFQYSLFDTVIIGASSSGYTIRYFYSDTLDPMYQPIEFMALENVLDSFDVVIIVPDSDGYLNSVAQAYGFTGEAGVVYVPDSSELVGNNWTGFAIVTEKAIAKQKLWNFNEGISKLYQLEVDYIDSEDKWKDSFLLWSASIFDMINSFGGQLNHIINIISAWNFDNYVERITDRLDELINNTGELEWDFWYMSLFSWINQFRPSNSDFAAGLQQFDNNWEEFPELPAPSNVPLLPTIGG